MSHASHRYSIVFMSKLHLFTYTFYMIGTRIGSCFAQLRLHSNWYKTLSSKASSKHSPVYHRTPNPISIPPARSTSIPPPPFIPNHLSTLPSTQYRSTFIARSPQNPTSDPIP